MTILRQPSLAHQRQPALSATIRHLIIGNIHRTPIADT